MKRAIAALVAVWVGVACRCSDGSTQSPSSFVAKDAEMVVEVPNIAGLAEQRGVLLGLLDGVASEKEIEEVGATLSRMLGFDPTKAETFEAAGLPRKGPLAVELTELGRTALWIVPVGDRQKLEKTLNDLIKSRVRADETKTEAIGSVQLTVFLTAWGPDKFPVAAYAIDRGYAFVGVGKSGPDRIKAALARKREESVVVHPEYQALDKVIGPLPLIRLLVPNANDVAGRFSQTLGKLEAQGVLAKSLTSLGWSLRLSASGLSGEGRLRFDEAGRKLIAQVFAQRGPAPDGVRFAHHPDAALVVSGEGDPLGLLAAIAPPGSPAAARVDSELAKVQEQLGVDVRKEVLPELSGHAALAFGLGDLTRLAGGAEAFFRDPGKVIWTWMALGVRSPDAVKKLGPFDPSVEPRLAARGLVRSVRKVGDQEVTVISLAKPAADQDPMVMETFLAKGAWIFGNSPALTEQVLKGELKPPADPLEKGGGVHAELRIAAVVKAVRAVDLGTLFSGAELLLVKSIAGKAFNVLDKLDKVELHFAPTEDGASGTLDVRFAAPKK